jgi:hypothetical protein
VRTTVVAAAGAAVVLLAGCSSSPTAHPTAHPSAHSAPAAPGAGHPADVLGPTGYGDLVLGMTIASARTTGLVAGGAHDGFRLRDGSQLCFQPGGVLTAITAPLDARTPEGIHDGSTEAEVRAAYHPGRHAYDAGWSLPAGPGAAYHFFITPDHGVSELTLEGPREDCWR